MKQIKYLITAIMILAGLYSCEDMLTVDSDRYVTEEDNQLISPNDSVSSILGLLTGLQDIAERYVLFGEMRGDLLDVTDYTPADIRALNNFAVEDTVQFADPRDFYAIINNCNYFISRTKDPNSPLKKENAVAHAIRAWVYMQITFNWGHAYYFTEPLLSVEDSEKNYPKYTISEMIDVLIADLEPLEDAVYPDYGTIYDFPSRTLLFPINLLLGDLYLWRGSSESDYEKAATYYAEFIDYRYRNYTLFRPALSWAYANFVNQNFETAIPSNSWTYTVVAASSNANDELVTAIQMATRPDEGTVSSFSSEDDGKWPYFYYSDYLNILWDSQIYAYYYQPTGSVTGSLYYTNGDLRKKGNIDNRLLLPQNLLVDNSESNKYHEGLTKIINAEHFPIYRMGLILLRYAESLNRAGKPNAAFAVLKHGLNQSIVQDSIPQEETLNAPYITIFNDLYYSNASAYGVHSRGSGNSQYNEYYFIGDPWGYEELLTKADSIDWVERTICDELAMETSFEGNRFQDLMRFALRRKEGAAFLADRVAQKYEGTEQTRIRTLLMDQKNWFLPEPKK